MSVRRFLHYCAILHWTILPEEAVFFLWFFLPVLIHSPAIADAHCNSPPVLLYWNQLNRDETRLVCQCKTAAASETWQNGVKRIRWVEQKWRERATQTV